jgi:hypothetical protein
MNIKRTIAAVIRAPLLAGDSIPNMANTEEESGGGGREGEREEERKKVKFKLAQGTLHTHIHTETHQ